MIELDECEQMRVYRDRVVDFWREHPGEKAGLAARGAGMLWDPRVTRNEEEPGAGTWIDERRVTGRCRPRSRSSSPPRSQGSRYAPRWFSVLAASLLAYQTVFAMLFVGATRYRAPWDFLLVLLAASAVAPALGHAYAADARRPRPPDLRESAALERHLKRPRCCLGRIGRDHERAGSSASGRRARRAPRLAGAD